MKTFTHMGHTISVLRGGEREMSWIQPTCSCGWIGRQHHAYNDYQHSNYDDDVSAHMEQIRREGARK